MSAVIDTSALTSVLLGDDDAAVYLRALTAHAGALVISAATLVEARIVLERKGGAEAAEDLDSLLRVLGVQMHRRFQALLEFVRAAPGKNTRLR